MAKKPGEGPPYPSDSKKKEERDPADIAHEIMFGRPASPEFLAEVTELGKRLFPETQPGRSSEIQGTEPDGGASMPNDPEKAGLRDKRRRTRGLGRKGAKEEEDDVQSEGQQAVQEVSSGAKPSSVRETAPIEAPAPISARSLELERVAQEQYYKLREEGKLPVGANGEAMSMFEFIDRVYDDVSKNREEQQPDTRAEAKKKLSEMLERHLPKKDENAVFTPEDLREARAREMAERLGIADKRERMLALEADYKKEVARNNRAYINLHKKNAKEREYAQAQLEWANALTEASVSLSPRERIRAHAIGIRDTTVRAEQARQEGLLMASGERSKKALGQVFSWAGKGVKLYMKGTEKAGKGVSFLHRFLGRREYSDEEKLKLQEQYTKAARIITSAGVGTLVFGGFGTLGVGLSFGLRAARGTLGIMVGAAAGASVGQLYKNTRGEKHRLALRSEKRKAVRTLADLAERQKAQQKGTRAAREQAQKNVELVTAFLTGAGVSFGSGTAIHMLEATDAAAENLADASEKITKAGGSVAGSAERVEDAARKVEEAAHASASAQGAGAAPVPAAAPEATPAPGVVTAAPEAPAALAAPLAEATIQRGEGFNSLFVELRASGTLGDSAVARHLMDPNLSASELSAEVKALVEGKSAVTQPGDRLFVDEKGLWFERDGVKQLLMEEKDGKVVTPGLSGIELRATEVEPKAPLRPEVVSEEPAVDADAERTAELNRGSLEGTPIEEASPVEDAPPESAAARSAEPATGQPAQKPEAPVQEQNVPAQPEEVAPASEEAPAADETADRQPVERAEPSYNEPFVNRNSISIDPRTSSIYRNESGTITVFGGDFAERFELAQDYAAEHPGTVVHLESSRPVLVDGQMRPWTTRVSMDPGTRQMTADTSPASAAYVGRPDPQSFTGKIANPS